MKLLTRDTGSVTRVVEGQDRILGRPLVVTLAPEGIYFRAKRQPKRNAFLLPYAIGALRAVDLHVQAKRPRKPARTRRPPKLRTIG